MSGLPRISGRECVKVLNKAGFYLKRQEDSHMVLRRDNPFGQVVVPDHKELDRGTHHPPVWLEHRRIYQVILIFFHLSTDYPTI